jgi:DNA-binding beta-propeller fold protein YncE
MTPGCFHGFAFASTGLPVLLSTSHQASLRIMRPFFSSLMLLAVLLSAGPARAAGIAIVVNSGEATLTLLDMTTGAENRRIPVLREPHHLALSPGGKELLVGDSAGNEMLFLDPATGAIRRRMPVADPYQLGFSPNAKFLVVTGLARNQVDVYDAATMQLAKRFPLGTMPSHLAYSPDSSVVYVTLQGTNRVAALDLKQMTVLWNAEVGATPAGIVWHDGKLLVANMGSDHFAVVDPIDGHVERRVRTGRGAHQIFPSPDGKTLWVNNRVDGTTVAVDARTLNPVRTYKIGGGPDCIDFAPDGKLWITMRFAQKVAVLDPASGDIKTYAVGRSPHGIFLTAAARP